MELIFCPECGAQLLTQKFCQRCGANISKYLNAQSGKGSSETLSGFDFTALENEASKQLREQEMLADFEIEDGVLIKYKGKGGKVVVPKSVTVIGAGAFSHDWIIREEITEVVFEGNITEIGEKAFWACDNLRSIQLPSTLKKIGNGAFQRTGMSEIALPSGLETIGTDAFHNSMLANITIPGSVTFGNRGIFSCCNNLRSVTIENGVSSLPDNIFDGCGSLESVTIPNSVRSIGSCAFRECVSLKNISVPYGVEIINADLFNDCRSLTRINLPGSVKSIFHRAFSGCRSLSDITIPQSVTYIADECFNDCVSLEKIQYNAVSVSVIGDADVARSHQERQNYAFTNAGSESGGINIIFGSSVKCVPANLFNSENCKVAGISFEGGSVCEKIGAGAFYKCSMVRSIQIPHRVVEIGAYAFFYCSSITRFELPSSVQKIGESAFSYCTSLVSITMPPYLTEIANHTFSSCESLQGITIPNGVTRIGECAFLGCDSLTVLEIPYSVKEIEHYAFKIRNTLTLKLPRNLAWHFFKEEYEINRDDWRLIEY